MADPLQISRRDFLGGLALGVAGTLTPRELLAATGRDAVYPPALTGMRGNHPGSFEVSHALAWAGKQFPEPRQLTDKPYDLVVVGGGISGLAAATFYRQAMGPRARILVLDNHDDFGGHAKRNEFSVDGQPLIGYGGSQSLDNPGNYSAAATGLLRDVGIYSERFYDYFDTDYYRAHGLQRGLYFSERAYGEHRTAPDYQPGGDAGRNRAIISGYPLPEGDREALLALLHEPRDYLAGMSREEKIAHLQGTSYRDFLLQSAGAPESVYLLLRDTIRGWWGVGWDAQSALEAARMEMPGTGALGLGTIESRDPPRDEPYIFHFPEGNAGVARALVRYLLPEAVPGNSMEDLVTARVNYRMLDSDNANCRIRLNSTAVNVRHGSDHKHVDVTYVHRGQSYRVRGKHVVMACYNHILPHICPELPGDQREAIAYAEKVPLVYMSIAVRNWQPFADLGYHNLRIPQSDMMHSVGLDFPVSMGGYQFTSDPSQPTVLHGSCVPCAPDRGLTAREQHVIGRRRLYETAFADFENAVVDTLSGALSPAGFDAQRDIAALTVNRWPHGYAYEYNEFSDPAEYGPDKGPHLLGARQLGRISIANSDASAYAYVDGAIDAAWRAIREQL